MDRETIVYEYRMNGMSEDDAEVHADIYCSKLDELATLRAENERLREHMREIDSIVDECEYDKKTRKTVDRLRHIAKEALQ